MSLKRKAPELEDDSDSDEPTYGRQILPVANLPAEYDGEPEDGMQYLFTVRREHRSLPHVTRVANPYEIALPAQIPTASDELAEPSNDGVSVLPSEEWRQRFEVNFRNLRTNFSYPFQIPQEAEDSMRNGQKLTPAMRERDHWWAFLQGKPQSDWDPVNFSKISKSPAAARMAGVPSLYSARSRQEVSSEYVVERLPIEEPAQITQFVPSTSPVGSSFSLPSISALGPVPSTSDSTQGPSPANEEVRASLQNPSASADYGTPEQRAHAHTTRPLLPIPSDFLGTKPREPLPRLLREIDHRYAVHLLMYFTYWSNLYLGEEGRDQQGNSPHQITQAHGRWMFALLAKVDDYCGADEMSTLRSLARACIALLHLRRQCSVPVPGKRGGPISEASCWLIIAAVASTWAQHDLWIDAQDALARPAVS